MTRRKRKEGRAIYWYEWLPWLFLVVTLPVTYWAWQSERALEFSERNNAFHQQFDQTSNQLVNQFKLFEQSLYSIRKLFDSSSFVSQDEFNAFAAEILHSKFSSGLHQIGFAKYINFNYPETYAILDPTFNELLKQLNTQPQSSHAPIIYLIKHETSAQQDPILDAFLNKRHQLDMESAALRGEMVISDRFKISLQDTFDCDCISMILPVYNRSKERAEASELDSKIDGWLFFNLNLEVIFNNALSMNAGSNIRYDLYDDSLEPPALIYQNVLSNDQTARFSTKTVINAHEKRWTLHAYSLPAFDKTLNHKYSITIGLLGLLGSFALTGVLYLLTSRLRTLDSLKRINKRLKFSDERWRFAIEGSGDGIWEWNVDSKKICYSKNWKSMFGYEENCADEEIGGWRNLVHPDDIAKTIDVYKHILKGEGDHSFECRLKCKDGSWKWVLSRGMVVSRGKQGKPLRIVGTHTDISQLKESEDMAWQHANYDALTGLPNRRMLQSKLALAIEKAKWNKTMVALLCLDLDDFGTVNDTFGPEQGDLLLQEVTKRLMSSVYRYEVVARYNGDEFAIFISDIDVGGLSRLDDIAQNVLSTMAEPFLLNGKQVFIFSSIGIAVYPEHANSVSDLIRCADQAMYASINKGGNCITYFTAEMQEKVNKRMRLTNDLRVALSKNELFIEYQPIIALSTETVCKAEALLRWRHPERGLISPVEFIPIAESTKLINEIGSWVLAESLKQCIAWRKSINAEFQISVNKSPVQFSDTRSEHNDWYQIINDVPLHKPVVIEITEGLLLDATGQVQTILSTYKKKGIDVALDDFGTGYCSLAYLQKFDIDYLKIDRSFVANLETSIDNRVLCRTIITMAHSLGMKVIAEGIETKLQRDVLSDAGCDFGQGFYFSKSLSPAAFEAYVKQ
jgi:diguanylate cyclase (GGDEF)-like protein/PAS domain S-box-containing protein